MSTNDLPDNSREAAPSSPSHFLSERMLRAQANPECAFPEAVQVLSREVLRMRAQCPPTAEVERMRKELGDLRADRDAARAELAEAKRPLLQTIDALRSGLAAVARDRDELRLHLRNIDSALTEAGRGPTRGRRDELERIRDLAGDLRHTVRLSQALRADLDPLRSELAKAGIKTGPRLSLDEAVAQLRGERDRWREKFEAATNASGVDSPHSAAGDAQSEESNADANNRQNRDPEGAHLEQQRRATGDGDPRIRAGLREPDGVPGCGQSVPADQRQAVRNAGAGDAVPVSAGDAPIGAGGVLATTQLNAVRSELAETLRWMQTNPTKRDGGAS